jgi:hypothetical protein
MIQITGKYVSADSGFPLSADYRLCYFYGCLRCVLFFCLLNNIIFERGEFIVTI